MVLQAGPGPRGATRWDPDQYLKFADHRLRPALELLGRMPLTDPRTVYDLGCGAGELTRMLAEKWPEASVTGVDSSQEMLETAGSAPSRVQWREADIRTWQPETPPDLIYSNATLQWVDGHAELFPRLVSLLAPGGCLAVQMPLSWGAASHRLMRQTLVDGGAGGTALGDDALRARVGRKWVDDADEYYDLLVGRTATIDIWETEYLQILEGDDPVLEWVKGTGLRPILNGLGEAERSVYLAEYARRLRDAYPMRANGKTLYPFRRLFIVATV
ncbi:MAG: methyltransferase domain-containing protein [Chloroflexi bacterium]|nr:methyltransferase domain-containing protein [Chloroflexota bacterium]